MAAKRDEIIWDAPPPAAGPKLNPNDIVWDAPAPEPSFLDTAGQYTSVATRALAPYTTAVAGGGLAGGAIAGPPGAAIGAGAAPLILGASDIGTGLYNIIAPRFGGSRVALPSESIQNVYESVGIGRRPETPTQQVFSDVLQAGAGGLAQAKGAQALETALTSPTAKNFMRFFGQNARGQTGAAMGGAAAPSVASNYFNVTDPKLLAAFSLGGAVAGGKAATPRVKPVSSSAIQQEATDLYGKMKQAGVQIAPSAMTDLETAARQRVSGLNYDPVTDKVVNEALAILSQKSGKPISYDMLDKTRRAIRDLPYSEAGGKRGTSEQRAMIKVLDDTIDEFMDNLNPAQISTGDAKAAARYLGEAREVRARAFRTEAVENAVNAARTASKTGNNPPSFANALRTEFGKIVKNPRKMAKFDADTRSAIESVAQGSFTNRALQTISKFAPSRGLIGLQAGAIGPGAVYAPGITAGIVVPQAIALGARGLANTGTKSAARNALVTASLKPPRPGGPGWSILSPAVQQNIMAQQRTTQNNRR